MTRKLAALHLSLAMLIAGSPGVAPAADLFDGPNCDLVEPPAEAGDVISPKGIHGTMSGRIFPRLSSMSPDYTGCQVLWSVINNGARYRSLIALRHGRVEAVRPDPPVPLCASGEKTIDTGCSPRQRGLLISFPAGCAKRTVDLGVIPVDCMKEFLREAAIHDLMKE
jgi:hypothetical protein